MPALQKVVSKDGRGRIQLAQSRFTGTPGTPVSVYSPPSYLQYAAITKIVVTEHAGATPTFSIFHDDDGTTYDQTTALFYGVALAAKEVKHYDYGDDGIPVAVGGNIAIDASAASQVTIAFYGYEVI